MQAEHVEATAEFSDTFYQYACLVNDLPNIRGEVFSEIDLNKIEIIVKKIIKIALDSHGQEGIRSVEILALLKVSDEYVHICFCKTDLGNPFWTDRQRKIVDIKSELKKAYTEFGNQKDLTDLLATTDGKKNYDSTWIELRRRNQNLAVTS